MNTKTLVGAAVLAAILILVGLLAYNSGAPPSETEEQGGKLFPDLLDRINETETLVLLTREGEYTIRKGELAWVLEERGGYPVQMEQVRPALIGLAELELVEKMTSNPASYSRLGVQAVGGDPTAETQSKQMTLKNAAGDALASVVIGKPREGAGGESFYVRRTADATSWLVRGSLPPLPDKGDEWLDKKILEIERAEVSAARISHGDGEVLTISKTAEETDYTLHELPEGRELRYASAANVLAGSMQYLNFDDVMPAAEFEAPGDPVSIAHLWTKDGMRVTAEVWEKEEKYYAAFSATYDRGGTPTTQIGPEPPPVEEPAEGEDPPEEVPEVAAEPEPEPRPQEVVQAEAEELNARLSPWVYAIPEYTKNNFAKRIEDLLKPLPEEEPAEAEPSIDSLGGDSVEPPVEDGGTPEQEGGAEEPPPVEKPVESGTGDGK